MVILALCFAISASATDVTPNFANVPTGWVTDRYEPASFSNVGPFMGRFNALGIGINSTTSSANRPLGQQGSFYNTQGRQFSFSPYAGPGSVLSADLYVPASWASEANGSIRTDVWGVMRDASNAISAYTITGFTNYGGPARFRAWDGDIGWINLVTPVNYGAWNRFTIELMPDTSFRYYVNGVLAYTDSSTGNSINFSAAIMQAFNFEDPALAPAGVIQPYTAHWANAALVVDDDAQASLADCDASDTAFNTIQGAINTAPIGSEIKVCPGTYNESPSVGKSLTIQSTAGRDVTTIKLNHSLATNGYPYGGIHFFNSGTAATLDGFTIEGNDGTATLAANSNVLVSAGVTSVQLANNRIRIGARNFISDGEDANGILTDYAVTPTIGSLAVSNTIIEPLNSSSRRPFYINPGVANLTIDSNSINGNFTGSTVSEAFNSVFNNNTVTGSGSSGGLVVNAGAPAYAGATFTSNVVSGVVNAITVFNDTSNVTITGNTLIGNGRGIRILGTNGTGNTANFNRIANNSIAGLDSASSATINAENNWWGCNYGPGNSGAGCPSAANGVIGSVDAMPYLTLTSDAVPGGVLVNGNSAITSRLTINSLNADTSGSGFVRNGTPATFAATLGTVAPSSNTTTSGVTNTTFTAGPTQGAGSVSTTVDGQTVTNTIGIYNSACAEVSTPTLSTKTAIPITIPVITDELTNRGVISIDFRLSYDPTVLSAGSLTAALGSVTAGATLNTFAPSPGELQVSIYTTTPFSGSGSIVDLTTNVIGPIGSTSPLTLSNLWYNGTLVCSTTVSGSVTVISGEVSGQVTYAHQPGVKPVPGANLSAPGVPPVSGVTNASGNYLLSGFGPGSYTVTPSKANKLQACDVGFSGPNGIFSNDASAISQHIVGITPITDPVQLNAAWVSEGTTPFLSSFDAALISQWIVCINNPINLTGRWFFTPVNRSYADVIPDFTNQDYTALLKGDVNGDWSDTGPLRPAPMTKEELENAVRVSIGDFKADKGTLSLVPLRIDNLNGIGVTSYQFDVEFDPNVLTPDEVGAEIERTISESLLVVSNSPSEGLLKVVVYGAWPVNGDGVYVNLRFRATGDVGASSPLSIRQFRFNDGNVRTRSIDGTMTILDPRGPRLTGTLVNSVGRPIGNALVVLTNSRGETMSVRSSRNGNYEFAGLDIGETYTISAKANGYTFSPISISMTRSTMSADLISDQ